MKDSRMKKWAARRSSGCVRICAGSCLVLCTAIIPAFAEVRCGWLENPTPGNLWLKDSKGSWIISAQGSPPAPGADRLPAPATNQFVATQKGGSYGYSCACVDGAFDGASTTVTSVQKGWIQLLAVCRNDHQLPEPP